MKKLSINELLKGYNSATYTDDLDLNTIVEPMLISNDIKEDSLLFIYDPVGVPNSTFDASGLSITPYAIVTSNDKEVVSENCPIIKVDNTRAALAYAMSNYNEIDYDKIKFIGITGTNGKTTTATLIYEILTRCGYRTGLISTGKGY